jgi:hypothetical protein
MQSRRNSFAGFISFSTVQGNEILDKTHTFLLWKVYRRSEKGSYAIVM